MRRTALILGVLAALVLAALVFILMGFYASPNKISAINGSSSVTAESFVPCGFQDSSYQPHGCWAAYLGFIPPGYTVASHLAHGATYPCPSGMTASQCEQFQTSCGNGVCDPKRVLQHLSD